MPYIELDLMTDPDALVEVGVRYLEEVIPGFVARPGNVETVLLEANAQVGAEIVEQVTQIDPLIFGALGNQLLGIAPFQASPAVAVASITWAADTPAVLYGAGSMIGVPSPTGEPVAFATDADVLAPAGGGVVQVGVTALEPGSAANGCFGTAEPIDIVDGITSVTVTEASGGTDEEEADAYLARLADAMRVLAPRPILPSDHAELALQVPGVGRATALDLYQPSTGQGGYGTPRAGAPVTNVPRCTTVAITAEGGAVPSAALLNAVGAYLDARREVNFLVYTMAPTYQPIDITASVVAYPGVLAAEAEANAEAELSAWLAPDRWGQPPGVTGGWVVDTKVRLYEAVDYANRAGGVHYVQALTLGKGGQAQSAADVTLTGPVTLPTPGAINVTVVPPS